MLLAVSKQEVVNPVDNILSAIEKMVVHDVPARWGDTVVPAAHKTVELGGSLLY